MAKEESVPLLSRRLCLEEKEKLFTRIRNDGKEEAPLIVCCIGRVWPSTSTSEGSLQSNGREAIRVHIIAYLIPVPGGVGLHLN